MCLMSFSFVMSAWSEDEPSSGPKKNRDESPVSIEISPAKISLRTSSKKLANFELPLLLKNTSGEEGIFNGFYESYQPVLTAKDGRVIKVPNVGADHYRLPTQKIFHFSNQRRQ